MERVLNLLKIAVVFMVSNCFAQSDIELRIIDSKLENGKWVNFELKNNSKFDYCFVMDTIHFWRDEPFAEGDVFLNPDVVLYDRKSKRKVTEMISVSTSELNDNDRQSVLHVRPQLITLKKHDTLKLRIPFSLIKKSILYEGDNLHSYYRINKKKKYNGRIEYMINETFIKKYFEQKVLDSLSDKGWKMFIGKLKSNMTQAVVN
jgi:hypothetical protein